MHSSTSTTELTIPIVEEEVTIEKQVSTTGRVRVRSVVDEEKLWIDDVLTHEEAVVQRVPMGRELDAWPEPRWEGDTLILPVVEEVVVAQKALLLKEEIHVRKIRREEPVKEPITLRRMRAEVERLP